VTTTYSYYGNFAVGLGEGPIGFVRRVWADGRELDLTTLTMRVYRGDETQAPDPLIVAKEGAENAPAYRGLAYVVLSGRETAEFGLSPRRIDLEPGDVVSLPTEAGVKLHRILRIEDGATRRVSTRAVEPAVFVAGASGEAPKPRPRPSIAGRPEVILLDLPVAHGAPPGLQYLAVAADPWPGAMAVWRSADGTGFALHATIEVPALIGRTTSALAPGPLWRWDRAAEPTLALSQDAISSVGDLAALGGANTFAVEGEDGRWEILSAAQAELIGARSYRLSRLLRGLAGSEPEAGRLVPAGARIVRLDAAVVPLTASLDELGQTWTYRIGPADRDHADPSVVEIVATTGPEALKPVAPVRLGARRVGGDVALSWVRRTRIGGDAWEPLDVPLGEDSQRYEVDILDGAALLPTLITGDPAVTYAAADELADLGTPQASLAVRIAQISPLVGRGFAATATLPIL
jgi:hypothetical protein